MLLTNTSFTAERRNHARMGVTSLTFIDLDDGNGGLILDLSEGGATVQATEVLIGDFFQRVRFRLPNAKNWIETSGRLVWQRRSEREAGIQFVDLAEDARNQIKDWVYLETLGPSMLTKKGRFKMVWEAEASSPTCISTTAYDHASSLGYDPAMFPSERSIAADSADRTNMPSRVPRTSASLERSRRLTRIPFVHSNEFLIRELNPQVRADEAPKQAPAESEVPRRRAYWERSSAPASSETLVQSQAVHLNHCSHLRLSSIATGLGVDDAPQRTRVHSLGQSAGALPQSGLKSDPETDHANSRSSPNELCRATQTTAMIRTSDAFPDTACPSEYRREQCDSGMPPRNGWILPTAVVLATGLCLGILLMRETSNSKSADARLEGNSVHGIADSFQARASQGGNTISSAPDATSRTQTTAGTLIPQSLSPTGSVSNRAKHRPAAAKHAARANIREINQRGPDLSPPNQPQHTELALRPPETEEHQVGALPVGVSGGGTIEPPLPPGADAQAGAPPAAPNDRTLDAYAEQNERATIQTSDKWHRFLSPLPHGPTANIAAAQTSPVVSSALQDSQSRSGTVAISSRFHAIEAVPNSQSQPSQADGNLKIGQLISIRQPAYPQNAARQRIEGTVVLRAVVGKDGTVRAVELVRGPLELVPAATSTVWNWRYEPTLLDGQPVESEEDITLLFRLTSFAASPRWENLR
jgi:TonB family protein